MSIMEGWKNVRCSIRIWASGIEREREKLFRTILTLIRNFYLFVFSPTFFVVYLSFNKMYIHIFPITFVKVYKTRLFINLAQIVLANFNGQIYYPFPGIFQYHSTMMFYSFEVHQSLNINRIVRVKSKSTCIPWWNDALRVYGSERISHRCDYGNLIAYLLRVDTRWTMIKSLSTDYYTALYGTTSMKLDLFSKFTV